MFALPAVKRFSLLLRRGLPSLRPGLRLYVVYRLLNELGTGLFYPFSVLYFHQVVGFSFPIVGLGLTLATGVSLATVPTQGALVDRFGARTMLIATNLLQAVGFLGYLLVHSFVAFILLAAIVAIGNSTPAGTALVAEIAAPEERDRWIGLTRMLANAGLGAGGLLGGIAIAMGGTTGYRWIVVLNALSFAVAAVMLTRLKTPAESSRIRAVPPGAATGDAGKSRATAGAAAGYVSVLRDRPFVVLVGVSTLLWISNYSVDLALAPYVVSVLHAPTWIPGVLFALNTLLVVVAQVPIMGLLASHRRTRAMMAGGLGYVVVFVCLALALLVPGAVLLPYLCVAVLLSTTAEVVVAPSIVNLAIAVAPASLRGRYLALSGLSFSAAGAITPLLATTLLAAGPAALWLTLVPLMLVASAVVALLERHLPPSALRAPALVPSS